MFMRRKYSQKICSGKKNEKKRNMGNICRKIQEKLEMRKAHLEGEVGDVMVASEEGLRQLALADQTCGWGECVIRGGGYNILTNNIMPA